MKSKFYAFHSHPPSSMKYQECRKSTFTPLSSARCENIVIGWDAFESFERNFWASHIKYSISKRPISLILYVKMSVNHLELRDSCNLSWKIFIILVIEKKIHSHPRAFYPEKKSWSSPKMPNINIIKYAALKKKMFLWRT